MVNWTRTLGRFIVVGFVVVFCAVAHGQSLSRISGSVVDAFLKPIAGAAVALEREGRVVSHTTSGADGGFVFEGVTSGDYTVRVSSAGRTTVARGLHVSTASGVIRLPIVLTRPEESLATSKAQDAGSAAAPAAVSGGVSAGGGRGGGRSAGAGGGATGAGLPRQMVMAQPYFPADSQWVPYQPVSGETYAPIDGHRFQSTTEHPLSTFGADVDTASYSNVRRFLSSGQLPPRDAVRVEELVNYFQFAYPDSGGGRPISLVTEVGDCPWAPAHRLVLIGARANTPAGREIGGRNIVLLIDVSGSMSTPERLPLVKTALQLFVETLRDDDTISIVTYAGASGVALPPTRAARRDVIQRAIAGLSAGGSTNGGQGLILAYRIASEAFVPGGVNRVILATDGDFNVGIVSQRDLLDLIDREKSSGVFLSVFGVGTGNLKDRTMEMLADHGNGHYAYLDSLQEARRILIRESASTLETVAKDVKFQVEFNPATVAAWKLLGYEDRALAATDFNNDRKDGGTLGAGHTVSALYELIPAGVSIDDGIAPHQAVDPLKYQPPSDGRPASSFGSSALDGPSRVPAGVSNELMTIKVRYKMPESDVSEKIELPVRPGARAHNLPAAAAVAEFGLMLRDDPRDMARWDSLLRRMQTLSVPAASQADWNSFTELVEIARGLGAVRH